MADKYRSPEMDWSGSGDIYERFRLFKQKCELIFQGPLADKDQAFKVRIVLLWVGDRGLKIYNTNRWANAGDNLRIPPVWACLEAYVRHQSNQILPRFQLQCLKQGNLALEEFVTRARQLMDDGGYPDAVKDWLLRDKLVFGITSDRLGGTPSLLATI